MNDEMTPESATPSIPSSGEFTSVRTAPEIPPMQSAPLPPSPKKKSPPYLLIGGGVILFLVVFVVVGLMSSRSSSSGQTQVLPTPSPFATPTPVMNQSAIATSAAFLEFSSENASFSAILNNFALQDPTLAAPVLDTEVTFTQ